MTDDRLAMRRSNLSFVICHAQRLSAICYLLFAMRAAPIHDAVA